MGTWKPRANRHTIVGQQLPTLLDVTCCVRLHTTANKDATTPKTVGPTLLGIEHHCQKGHNNSQHCWSNIVESCCVLLHVA